MNDLKCQLCLTNSADKLNSHIISKFLGKSLFELSNPRFSIQFGRNGMNKEIYDIPKEDFLFCQSCEERMAIIETLFARHINNIHKYERLTVKFELKELKEQEYLNCLKIHPTAYKLFVYLQVWRTSITSVSEFKKFKIPKTDEEKLRNFLNLNLKPSNKELVQSLSNAEQIPKYHNCFVKPLEKSENSRGIFTAYNIAESMHLIMAVDFAIIFFTNSDKVNLEYKSFSNMQSEMVKVVLAKVSSWNGLNVKIIRSLWD